MPMNSRFANTRARLVALVSALMAVALLAFVAAGCGDKKKDTSVPKDAVARVGDEVISKKEFDHWLLAAARQQAQSTGQKPAQVKIPDAPEFTECIASKKKAPVPKGVPKPSTKDLKTQCEQEYKGLKDQTMQFLVSAQWLLQEADKRKIKVSDSEVQKQFEEQKKQSFPKEKDYEKFLKTSGQTEKDLLFRVRLSVLTNKLQQSVVKSVDKVTDDDVKKYYEKNKERFAQPETRDLLVVLTSKKAKADAALAEIKSGTKWAKVAKKYSTDDASKSQGGKLPAVSKGQQEKALDTAIFKAKKGENVGPVKTQFGYYVFRVTKITPAKQQTLEQVSETVRNQLQSQNQQKAINDFVKDFQKRYKALTNCAKDYVIEQCKNAPKPKKSATTPQGTGGPEDVPQQQAPPSQQVPQQGAPPQGAPPSGGGAAPPQGAPPSP